VSPSYTDEITQLKDITEQPFWVPSQSLQLKMVTHAHALIEVLNMVSPFRVCTGSFIRLPIQPRDVKAGSDADHATCRNACDFDTPAGKQQVLFLQRYAVWLCGMH